MPGFLFLRWMEIEGRSQVEFGSRSLDLKAEPCVMGVLNVTPDSFSDGGVFNSFDSALKHAERMIAEGAAIIDVGGESTRPGAGSISEHEEVDRVCRVVEGLCERFNVVISVDTSTPKVMRESVRAGAALLNDVRSFSRPGALSVAADLGVPVCLMHMQGEPQRMQHNPQYQDVVEEVFSFLSLQVSRCEQAGISRDSILIDPGFGFGKSLSHNLLLLRHLKRFQELGLPILVGMSRKSMIGGVLGVGVGERLYGSVAAAAIAVSQGASIVRAHDVRENVDAVRFAAAVRGEQ